MRPLLLKPVPKPLRAFCVRATKLTKYGHELWGVVGCSLSHQLVLNRILADTDLEYALIGVRSDLGAQRFLM